MLIVSQDKMNTTEDIELQIEEVGTIQKGFPIIIKEPITYHIVDRKYNIHLGIYQTEERAKEVLREIIFAYNCSQGKSCTIGDIEKLSGKYEKAVYEMPEN